MAPIVLFVYKRPEQTKKVIESLKENVFSRQSELFIFSDGFRDLQDKELVLSVRSYINTIKSNDWFEAVHVYESKTNRGLANSIIDGVSKIIGRYGKVIVLEDDLIISPYFLKYMNECLDFFEQDERIWAVCGYTPELQSLKEYDCDVYLNYRASTWGWGTWTNRWADIDWSVSDYRRFRWNLPERIRFCFGGNDTVSMLKAQMNGKLDSWGIRWCYAQSRRRKLAVAPRKSLVQNIGFDSTGTHSKSADEERFCIEALDDARNSWSKDGLKLNFKILYEIYQLYSLTLMARIVDKGKEIYGRRQDRKR